MKSALIRCGFAALSLAIGVTRLAHAATYNMPQPTAADRQPSSPTVGGSVDRVYASQSGTPMGTDGHTGSMGVPAPTHKETVRSGNDFNWLAGGGG